MHNAAVLNGMDLTQVRLLAALADHRNLSGAARRIGLSQSAASHALTKLRDHLGDPLFIRGRTGVHPTPYGERVGTAARHALSVLSEGIAANQPFDPQVSRRRFNIYLSDVGQVVMLPRILAFLSKEAPHSSLRVCPVPVETPGIALASGEVDLAIGFFNNLTTGFHQNTLGQEHYVCMARAGHPLFRHGMTLDAFLQARQALADSSGMAHAALDRHLAKHKIRRQITLVVPEFVVLPMLVAQSDLLVIMPARLAQAFSGRVPVDVFEPPVPLPQFAIKAYWHERFHHDATNCWLRRTFLSLFRGTDWNQSSGSAE
ncbi:MAG: LysR family transcriptional regulator [Bryobacteraceae bacterium]